MKPPRAPHYTSGPGPAFEDRPCGLPVPEPEASAELSPAEAVKLGLELTLGTGRTLDNDG